MGVRKVFIVTPVGQGRADYSTSIRHSVAPVVREHQYRYSSRGKYTVTISPDELVLIPFMQVAGRLNSYSTAELNLSRDILCRFSIGVMDYRDLFEISSWEDLATKSKLGPLCDMFFSRKVSIEFKPPISYLCTNLYDVVYMAFNPKIDTTLELEFTVNLVGMCDEYVR